MLQHNHATEREYPRRPMNLRILPTRYAHQNTAPWCMYALVVWRSALCCRPHWSHSHLDFGAVLFCVLCSTSTMAQVRAQRPRMSPEWCSIRTNVKSKISSKFLSWGKWIFRNSTAVSPQCLQYSAEWNIASSSNPFQNCFLWRGHMCVRGRFQRHTRKINFAQNKTDFGLSAGIRLWGPVMDFYRPFVIGWQNRVANFLDNVQRQNREVLNTVEQCWTLLRHCALDV